MNCNELQFDMNDMFDSIKSDLEKGIGVTISGCGNSMHPFIENGTDRIMLNGISENKKIRVGEIYFYRRSSGTYAIHRVYKAKKDYVLMLGDAQLFIERVPQTELIAIVTKVFKADGTVVDCLDTSIISRNALKSKFKILKHRIKTNKIRVVGFTKGIIFVCARKIAKIFRKK